MLKMKNMIDTLIQQELNDTIESEIKNLLCICTVIKGEHVRGGGRGG